MMRFTRLVVFVLALPLSLLLTVGASAEEAVNDFKNLVNAALSSAPDYEITEHKIAIADERVNQAIGSMLPQLTYSKSRSSVNRLLVIPDLRDKYKGDRESLTLTQTLFDKAKYHKWQQMKLEGNLSSMEQQSVKSQLILEVVSRYLSLLQADGYLDYIKAQKTSTRKRLDQIEVLYEKQHAKVSDLYQTRARLDSVLSDEIEAINNRDNAVSNLSELVGFQPDYILPLNDNIEFSPEADSLESWLEKALAGNTKLRELEISKKAERQQIQVEQSGHFPVLDLRLSKLRTNLGADDVLSVQTDTETASVNLTVPLFSGGQTSARVAESRERLKIIESEYEREYRAMEKNVKSAYLSLQTSARRIEALKKAILSAEKSYQAMNRGFELGVETVIDVLNAEEELNRVKQDMLEVKTQFVVDRTALYQIAGLLNDDYINEINSWLKH